MADDGHSEFRKNANISVLDTDIFTQFHKDATQADYGQHLCKMVFSLLSREHSDDNSTSSFFYATCYVSYITLYAVTACITSTKWAAHTTLTNYAGKWWFNFQLTHPKMSSSQIYSATSSFLAYSEDGLNMYNFHCNFFICTSGLLPDFSKLPPTCTHTSHAGKHSWYAYRL